MTADEYWDGPGIRFLNKYGTLPTVEERVKAAPLEKATNDLRLWMRLQEAINREVADEIRTLRNEIQKLKEAR